MTANRTRVLAVAVLALVVAAGVAVLLVRSSRSSPGSVDLAASVPAPAGVTPQTFAPAGLGATLMVPSQWRNTPPTSGFQYVIGAETEPAGFVGAGQRGGVVPVTVGEVKSARKTFLESLGAKIDSTSTGTVDNRPAVRLHYRLTAGGLTVTDTEYDIIATSNLAVGASQHQTTYNVITIVVGTPVLQQNPALTDWIGSTIRIHT
jgi:hypothetical protein